MYYLLGYNIEDSKTDIWFNGEIYNNNQVEVDDMFMFSSGNALKQNEIQAPFKIILDEKESGIKNKKLKDKISTSTTGAGFLFMVSPVAEALFLKLKIDNMQYFDVTVKSKGFELNNYKIVNITDKIDCADLSASVLEMKKDQIRSMTSLVLDENKIPKNKKIFLLGRKKTAIVLVHENLKKSIEEGGLTGFRFFELENARGFY
ncbi:MAG TPA: DUF1629 domain-containing protein [Bacteroidia bacterium]|nr:DUF1629 domain-containing protein [Bacteroidia bacterium]